MRRVSVAPAPPPCPAPRAIELTASPVVHLESCTATMEALASASATCTGSCEEVFTNEMEDTWSWQLRYPESCPLSECPGGQSSSSGSSPAAAIAAGVAVFGVFGAVLLWRRAQTRQPRANESLDVVMGPRQVWHTRAGGRSVQGSRAAAERALAAHRVQQAQPQQVQRRLDSQPGIWRDCKGRRRALFSGQDQWSRACRARWPSSALRSTASPAAGGDGACWGSG